MIDFDSSCGKIIQRIGGDKMETDERLIAVRDILLTLYALKDRQPHLNINPVVRQTLFYLCEGGERAKFSLERPHSRSAREWRNNAPRKMDEVRKYLCYEHAIPLAALTSILPRALSNIDELRTVLHNYLQGTILTRQEDAKLNDQKFRQSMPSRSMDLMARYTAAGIDFLPEDEAKLKRDLASDHGSVHFREQGSPEDQEATNPS